MTCGYSCHHLASVRGYEDTQRMRSVNSARARTFPLVLPSSLPTTSRLFLKFPWDGQASPRPGCNGQTPRLGSTRALGSSPVLPLTEQVTAGRPVWFSAKHLHRIRSSPQCLLSSYSQPGAVADSQAIPRYVPAPYGREQWQEGKPEARKPTDYFDIPLCTYKVIINH